MRRLLLGGFILAAVAQPASAASQNVGIANFAFTPSSVSVQVGDSVTWRWNGPDTNHSVTTTSAPAAFDSDPGEPPSQINHAVGEQLTYSFTLPGAYNYVCKVHTFMTGRVEVAAQPDGSDTTDTTRPVISSLGARPASFCKRHRRCRRPGTLLSFGLSEAAEVNIQAIGRSRQHRRVVRTFELGRRRAGRNRVRFLARRLPTGRYLLKLTATDAAGNSSRIARVRVSVEPPPSPRGERDD